MKEKSQKSLNTVIAGLGSWQGDDQAGWRLIELLRKCASLRAQLVALQEPTELITYLDGCHRLVIVDACLSGAAPGSIFRFRWPDVRIDQLRSESSHSFGIGSTLHLSERLGKLPQQVVVFGIEVEACHCLWKLTSAVEHGLHRLKRRVLREVSEAVHA